MLGAHLVSMSSCVRQPQLVTVRTRTVRRSVRRTVGAACSPCAGDEESEATAACLLSAEKQRHVSTSRSKRRRRTF